MADPTHKNHQDKIVIPEEVYAQPSEIVTDRALTWEEKMTALKNWEMDEKAVHVADGENMTAAPSNDTVSHGAVLKKIHEAERKLEAGAVPPPPAVSPYTATSGAAVAAPQETVLLVALIAMNIGACLFYRKAAQGAGAAECGRSFLSLEKMHNLAVTDLIHALDRTPIAGTEAERLFAERYAVFEKLQLKGLPTLKLTDMASLTRAEEECSALMQEKLEAAELSSAAKFQLSCALRQLQQRQAALDALTALAGAG